jgi:hypothetical protein
MILDLVVNLTTALMVVAPNFLGFNIDSGSIDQNNLPHPISGTSCSSSDVQYKHRMFGRSRPARWSRSRSLSNAQTDPLSKKTR